MTHNESPEVAGPTDTIWRRLVRYATGSLATVAATQATLLLLYSVLGWPALWSNVGATVVAAVPAYFINRQWVWRVTGRHSVRREILPFWMYTLAGLVVSTGLVVLVDQTTSLGLLVVAANLAGWGLVWIAKFSLFETRVFRHGGRSE